MVLLQQREKNVSAQPIVGGHIFSRLANIDVLTFGSRRVDKTILHVLLTISNNAEASRGYRP